MKLYAETLGSRAELQQMPLTSALDRQIAARERNPRTGGARPVHWPGQPKTAALIDRAILLLKKDEPTNLSSNDFLKTSLLYWLYISDQEPRAVLGTCRPAPRQYRSPRRCRCSFLVLSTISFIATGRRRQARQRAASERVEIAPRV